MKPKPFKVAIHQMDPDGVHGRIIFEDATPEQARAYAEGRADWRDASPPSWPVRLWKRIFTT